MNGPLVNLQVINETVINKQETMHVLYYVSREHNHTSLCDIC
jgi:hypothetical protein